MFLERTPPPMELETLKDLYLHELKDLFSAEQQLVKALPKMAKAASNKELAGGFQTHLEQTKEHAQRLQQILTSHKATTRGPKCKGMEGIVAEGAEMIVSVRLTASTKTDRDLREIWDGRKSGRQETAGAAYRYRSSAASGRVHLRRNDALGVLSHERLNARNAAAAFERW